ncbi:hypothetical protein HDU79_000788 [Rhizoclosmatium sp. JEL0117]|nr:hypothetical protein HDU79_000788 [Rhizoclosmatium sp. JEL0117]
MRFYGVSLKLEDSDTVQRHQKHNLQDLDSDDSDDCPALYGTPLTQQQQHFSLTSTSPSLLDPNSPSSASFGTPQLQAHPNEKYVGANLRALRLSGKITRTSEDFDRCDSTNNVAVSSPDELTSFSSGLRISSPMIQSPPPLPPQHDTTTPPMNSASTSITHKSLLRSQVASTLHKTLQLEHKLTMKELESYEKQNAAAELELQRSVAALHAAQVVLRERRRELDIAIMERSGVSAIVKHLRERLDSLSKRMWDGEDSKRRGELNSVSSAEFFDGDNEVFGVPKGTVSTESLVNVRRHSSPGYTFVGSGFNISSGNTSLDESDVISCDQDEVKAMADVIHDSIALDDYSHLIPDPVQDDFTIGVQESGKESEVAVTASEEQHNSKFKLKSNSFNDTQSQGCFTFPAVTMTRLHSSGPLSTSNKVSDLAAFRRASLGVNVLQNTSSIQLLGGSPLSPQSNSEISMTRVDNVGSVSSVACVAYQRGICLGTGSESCKAQHACVRCNGNHPVILCKKDRNVCVKWNMEECNFGCYREHRCLRCASRHHTLRVCPIRPLGGSEFCFAWNSAGTCRIMDCRRLHECIRCGASHPSIICPENLDNYLSEYIAKRRSEGLADDDLLRLELQLTHSLPSSSVGTTVDKSGLSSASTPNPSMGIMLPPLPYSASSMYNHQTVYGGQNGSMVVGPPLQSPHQQHALGMRGGDHPMHIAAAAAAARIVSGGANSAGSSGGRDPYNPMILTQTVYGSVGSGGFMTGGFDGKGKKNSISNAAVNMYDGTLLSDAEKQGICRDYNNLKCESDENRCRFRHVCLRCGSGGHRERQCPLYDLVF